MRINHYFLYVATFIVLLAARIEQAGSQTELPLTELIANVDQSVVRIDVTTRNGKSIGSGFLVDESGLVVTNHHVIAGAMRAKATFQDGKSVNVEGTRYFDGRLDLAILEIKAEKLRALPLAAELPAKGESVVAFGAPQGLSFSASEGIVSAIRQGKDFESVVGKIAGTWLQTTTPISPGNSGGPLVNRKGEVVGANTMQLVSGQNLNFAISSVEIARAIAAGKALSLVPLMDGAYKEKSREDSGSGGGSSSSPELTAEELPTPGIAQFVRRGEQLRLKVKGELTAQLSKLKDDLKDLKDGRVNSKLTKAELRGKKYASVEVRGRSVITFPDDQTKKEAVALVDDAIDKLMAAAKKIDDPKEGLFNFLTTMAGPALSPNQVGDIGCAYNIRVTQITGPKEFHAMIGNARVVFRGIDTGKFINGSKIDGGVNYVAGTETYSTVGRTLNTIFVVKPLPVELLRQHTGGGSAAITNVAKESKSAALMPVTYRTWTDKSGKFSVEARFSSRIGDKVVLEKADGQTIEVNVSILSDDDQAFLKAASKK